MTGNSKGIVEQLVEALGSDRVTVADAVSREEWHDRWVLSELDDLEEVPLAQPACRVAPGNEQQVVAVVNACRASGTPLVPQGLRSGVCGGIRSTAGAVHLDLSDMTRIHSVDPVRQTARFDAGVRGSTAESEVGKQGMTLGHFPQSIDLSSVGGWVATRAAGQFSTGYGNIEDMLLALRAVLPDGSVVELGRAPRASAGPDLRHLLLGSEGSLGVITEVELSLHNKPEHQTLAAYYVPNMAAGFELQRRTLHDEWRPVVLRQYDSKEVMRLFPKFRSGSDGLLLVVHEGPRSRVEVETKAMEAIAQSLGCTSAPVAATEHWMQQRNHVPTFRSFLEKGIMVDTIEVAAPYDKIEAVYNESVAALSKIEGIWNGSAHSSHAYRSGLNLYFSFAVKPKDPTQLRHAYNQCWDAVMEATVRASGTIAHHHGIGRVRRRWLERELNPAGLSMLRALKNALDPSGFMNPGVLLPDPD